MGKAKPKIKTKNRKAAQSTDYAECPHCGAIAFVGLRLHSYLCLEYQSKPDLVHGSILINDQIQAGSWRPEKETKSADTDYDADYRYGLMPAASLTPCELDPTPQELFDRILKIFPRSTHKILISNCSRCNFPRGFVFSDSETLKLDYLCFCQSRQLIPISVNLEILKNFVFKFPKKAKSAIDAEIEIIKKGFPEFLYLANADFIAQAPQGCDLRPEEGIGDIPKAFGEIPYSSGQKP